MTESKRRVSIEKIQARQNRYKAMGRCWCGREVRPGYKRCDNCMKKLTARRMKYQQQGRCYCGTPVESGVKRNGTPYKTCDQCRQRSSARYHQQKGGL